MSSTISKAQSGVSDTTSSARSLLGNVMGIAPLAIGGAIGYNALRSNEGSSLLGLRTNALKSTGAIVGDNIRRMEAAREAIRQTQLEKLRVDFESSANIKGLLRESVEKKNALLQSLLSTLEEPGFTASTEEIRLLKGNLLDLMRQNTDEISETADQIVQRTLDTVKTNQSALRRYQSFNSTYDRIKSQIIAPVHSIGGIKPIFNQISDYDLVENSPEAARFNRLKRIVGNGADIRVVRVSEDIGESIYARIYGSNNNFVSSIPLRLARKTGVPVVRIGESMATPYTVNPFFGDASKALEVAQGLTGKQLNRQNVMNAFTQGANPALFSYEDMVLNEFGRSTSRLGGNFDAFDNNAFHAFQRTFGEVKQRVSLISPNVQSRFIKNYATHLNMQLPIIHSQATFMGLENLSSAARTNFRATLAGGIQTEHGGLFFEPGTDATLSRLPGDRMFTNLGINTLGAHGTQSAFSAIRAAGLVTRATFPVTAREQQMIGRESMFMPIRTDGVDKYIGRGKTFTSFGNPIEWDSNMVSGHINRGVVMDVRTLQNAESRFGILEGEALTGGTLRVVTPGSKTVFDPTAMNTGSRKLLDKLLELHNLDKPRALLVGNMEGADYTVKEFFKQFQGALGTTSSGEAFIPYMHGTSAIELSIAGASETRGRQQIHIGNVMVRDIREGAKVFGMQQKVTLRGISGSAERALQGRFSFGSVTGREFMKGLGLGRANTIYGDAAMLKKAPDILINQMIGALGLLGKYDNPEAIHNLIAQAAGTSEASLGGAGITAVNKLERVSSAVMSELSTMLSRNAISAPEAGSALAGLLYAGSEHGLGKFTGGTNVAVETMIGRHFGANAASVIEAAKTGIAITASTFMAGPMPGEWKDALGSMEPRLYKFLHHRLKNMLGIDDVETSKIMTSFLARKEGITQQLPIVRDLIRSVGTMSGQAGMVKELMSASPHKMNIDEFLLQGMKQEEDIAGFLASKERGIMLDLTSRSGGDRYIEAAAQHEFGGSKQIWLPGGSTVENMRSTLMKTAEGETIEILPKYLRNVQLLQRNLLAIRSAQSLPEESLRAAQESLGVFREEMSTLFGTTLNSITRGKILGSSFMQAAGLKLGGQYPTVALSPAQREMALAITKKTGGNAVFANAQGFLTAMKDYMGGVNAEGVERSVGLDDMAFKAERFFTGTTRRSPVGLPVLLTRHPALTPSHITPVQLFRHVGELGEDKVFGRFTSSREGKQALADISKRTGRNITSFADIANLGRSHVGARRDFFKNMMGSLNSWMGEIGGGMLYLPDQQIDATLSGVHFNAQKRTIDMSIASGLIGDYDGDQMQLYYPSKKQGATFMKNMVKQSAGLNLEQQARLETKIIMEEAKSGIGNLRKNIEVTGGVISEAERSIQRILQEEMAKNIGPLDIALNQLRTGMVYYGKPEEKELLHRGMGLLSALEESVIKGKSLPIYLDFPGAIRGAVGRLMNSGSTDALESVLQNLIFKDSPLMQEGGLRVQATLASGHAIDSTIDLQPVFKMFRGVAESVRSNGLDQVEGTARLISAMKMDTQAKRQAWASAVESGEMVEASIVKGVSTKHEVIIDSFNAISQRANSLTNRLNRRFLTPVIGGAIAAVAIGGILGNNSYAPTPLLGPGEVLAPQVSQAISQGTLFNQGGRGPAPESFQSQPSIPNSPMSMGDTYLAKPNPYQMHGQLNGYSSLGAIGSLFSAIGGSASVRINDTRRPITPNYIDRLMGE